jgi:hypothetical protein
MLRRDDGDVIRGGSAGWLGFGGEAAAAVGEVTGEEVVDITAVADMPFETESSDSRAIWRTRPRNRRRMGVRRRYLAGQ